MTELLHLTPANARRMPWKNGRGESVELAAWPYDIGPAEAQGPERLWRLSTAEIHASGAFSSFPEGERILVVLEGSGLTLSHEGSAPRARLRPLEPYRFSGSWPTRAELVQGSVRVLNLITDARRVEAGLQALRMGPRQLREDLDADQVLIHAVQGGLELRLPDEEQPIELACGDTLVIAGMDRAAEVDLQGATADCTIVLARIDFG